MATELPVTTTHKTVIAGIGATLTALTTALAAVTLATNDGAIDIAEVGTLATALLTLVATVYGVWRVPNKPVDAAQHQDTQPDDWRRNY